MIAYNLELCRKQQTIGKWFLAELVEQAEPDRNSHARTGWFHARGVIAYLSFRADKENPNGLFNVNERRGIYKLIRDLGSDKLREIAELMTKERTKIIDWKKDKGAGVHQIFVAESIDEAHT
jgi:hypothetical protein